MKISKERLQAILTSPLLDYIIRFIVVGSVVMMALLSFQVGHTNACLRTFIDRYTIANEAARIAASEDRKVVDDMVIRITQAKTANDTRSALSEYLAARAKNDQFRAAHPAPPAKDLCG